MSLRMCLGPDEGPGLDVAVGVGVARVGPPAADGMVEEEEEPRRNGINGWRKKEWSDGASLAGPM